MICFYHRSSSLGALDMCEMKYFFVYVLGMKDKPNKKAMLGTIFHRVMQVLADKRLAELNGKEMLENDDIGNLTFDECDDIQLITTRCFNYYSVTEPELSFEKSDLNTCIAWVHKALAYKRGELDPRKQNVFATEKFFDIEIPHEWARYDYKIDGKVYTGQLSIKGTVDLILKEGEGYFQILDYKTGKRLNWATEKEKTHADLQKDPQLLLYYYALRNLYPDWSFYVSIYYVNDGGVFDVVFDDHDYEKAENMLRQKFQYIKEIEVPSRISSDQQNWKCQKLCRFSEYDLESGKTICSTYHNAIKKKGIDFVTSQYGNIKKALAYQDGGGRIAKND